MRARLSGEMLVAVLLACASPSLAFAQAGARDDLAKLHADLVKVRLELLEWKAEKSVWEHDRKRLEEAKTPGVEKFPHAHAQAWTLLLQAHFNDVHIARKKQLEKLEETLKEKHARAKTLWRDAQIATSEIEVEERAAKSRGGPLAAAEPSFWDMETIAIIAWGGLILVTSVLLGLHSLRRELRRRRRLKGSFAAAALLGFALLNCLGPTSRADGPADETWENKEAKKLKKSLQEETRQAAELKKEVNELRDEVRAEQKAMMAKWAASLPSVDGEGFQEQVLKEQKKAFETVHNLFVLAETIRKASEEGLAAAEKNAGKRSELAAQLSEQHERTRGKVLTKVGLCFAFMFLAFVPLRFLDRSSRKEQAKQAQRCPLCLQEGSLQAGSNDDEHSSVDYLECVGVDGQDGCKYKFRAKYQKWPRLCFPTIGIRSSGKTHWLVTAYDRIQHHREAIPLAMHTAPSDSDATFEMLIEQILEQHSGARATTHDRTNIPLPLVFHVRDKDRLGRNRAMLNLFDFSGELMLDPERIAHLRRRALLMDGFVLFLDPTQLRKSKDGKSLSLKEQVQSLRNFYEEMCDIRKLDVGATIPVPIAVCISKLDLVVNHSLGGQARPWIKSLRDSYSKEPYSLAAIHKRSELCEQAIRIMFDGWNVTQTLRENFGNSFLYFPMTPVNLVEAELGSTDLRNRTPDPVGTLQPILWLLHMHGYSLFK